MVNSDGEAGREKSGKAGDLHQPVEKVAVNGKEAKSLHKNEETSNNNNNNNNNNNRIKEKNMELIFKIENKRRKKKTSAIFLI